MSNKITEIPFRGTPEQEAQLKDFIAAHQGQEGALMPVLQKAQEIYGYLPIEVQTMVAEGLNVSLEQVYGVFTAGYVDAAAVPHVAVHPDGSRTEIGCATEILDLSPAGSYTGVAWIVPEPSTWILATMGLVGVVGCRVRRRRR